MPEERFFFGEAPRLYGCLHRAAAPSAATPLVYVHPFGEEHLYSSRASVEFARALATEGTTVLRFDARGSGDSEGDLSDLDASSWLADLDRAVAEAKRRTGASKVALWGLRLGASIALLAASRRRDVDSLLLWEPVADGRLFFESLFRQLRFSALLRRDAAPTAAEAIAALERGEPVGVRGEILRPEAYRSFAALDFSVHAPGVSSALVVGLQRSARHIEHLQSLASCLSAAGAAVALDFLDLPPLWNSFRHRDWTRLLQVSRVWWLDRARTAA